MQARQRGGGLMKLLRNAPDVPPEPEDSVHGKISISDEGDIMATRVTA
jgi:hypothetical protein